MNSRIAISFSVTPSQGERLAQLQKAFAAACNHLGPIVQKTRCWNRVALHHMVYRPLRENFPMLGSQMVCNAIYSVSRTCRAVYQNRQSPYSLQKLAGRPLPRVIFLPNSPVYFDRHTLSLKDGQVSMYTMDGRIKFDLDLSPEQEQQFRSSKLREIVLSSRELVFTLNFSFATEAADALAAQTYMAEDVEMPEYVLITDDPLPSLMPLASALPSAARLAQ